MKATEFFPGLTKQQGDAIDQAANAKLAMKSNQYVPMSHWELLPPAETADGWTTQQIVAQGRGVMLLKHDGSPEGLANAETIVRAVNNHQALVDALNLCLDQLNRMAGAPCEDQVQCHWDEDSESARSAAAKVLAALDPIPTPAVSANLHQPLTT